MNFTIDRSEETLENAEERCNEWNRCRENGFWYLDCSYSKLVKLFGAPEPEIKGDSLLVELSALKRTSFWVIRFDDDEVAILADKETDNGSDWRLLAKEPQKYREGIVEWVVIVSSKKVIARIDKILSKEHV
jgi:hypothetical protein